MENRDTVLLTCSASHSEVPWCGQHRCILWLDILVPGRSTPHWSLKHPHTSLINHLLQNQFIVGSYDQLSQTLLACNQYPRTPQRVSHRWGVGAGVLSSDTTLLGADQGCPFPPSSRTLNSSHQSGSRQRRKGHELSRESRRQTCRLGGVLYLQPVVLCVHYSCNTDEHGVPLIDSLQLHPYLKPMRRSLRSMVTKVTTVSRLRPDMTYQVCSSYRFESPSWSSLRARLFQVLLPWETLRMFIF